MSVAVPRAWHASDPEVAAVLAWWDENRRPLPWRATRDLYAIWVAEVMSAQTTVIRAAEAWERWMARWPTVDLLAAATLTEVLALWQGLGYPRRARDLHRSARIVAESGWPDDLTTLPGVGAYVAGAIRCFALEEPVLPRDVNVRRVLERRFPGGVDIAGEAWRAGQALMEFGQRVCTAKPRCTECPVRLGCPALTAGGGTTPVTADGRRRPRTRPRFQGSLRQRRGQLLRRVISEGSVAAGAVDAEAAAGLVADGLVVRDGEWLRAPS